MADVNNGEKNCSGLYLVLLLIHMAFFCIVKIRLCRGEIASSLSDEELQLLSAWLLVSDEEEYQIMRAR